MIKLCYKEYDFKLSLKAIKGFKKDTREDLMFTLSRVLECWSNNSDLSVRARINELYLCCDFELAAYAFYHLIRGSDSSIPLSEIEDAMFRVGITPNKVDDELCQPWTLVLVGVAESVESEYSEGVPQKK